MPRRTTSLGSILDRIEALDGDGPVSLGEIVRLTGKASFAPMLIIPAIALVSPLSGIPFFSSMMGMIIFLVSVQMLLRRKHLWLPDWLLSLKAERTRVRKAFQMLHPFVAWLDRHTHRRLTILTHRPFVFIPQLLCVVSGMILPMMELIPFSSTMVGLSVSLLAIGMFARDGVLLLLACLPYVVLAGLITKII